MDVSALVESLLKYTQNEPNFFNDYHNIGRGITNNEPNLNPHIKRSKSIIIWRIVGNSLEPQSEKYKGFFFNSESYLVQWLFDFYVDKSSILEERLLYYWRGENATKGFSPLSPDLKNDNAIAQRIVQWSEPALFFHMFKAPLVVFQDSESEFTSSETRLFIVRGELENEIHLYELPCFKENLRSRGVFILLVPKKGSIYVWFGSIVSSDFKNLLITSVKPWNHLRIKEKSWSQFQVEYLDEECLEKNDFFLNLQSENDYFKFEGGDYNFSPRLFYFNSITGDFLATEVEYPLKSNTKTAPFPFLQTHLYSADQPALFMIDNNTKVWLWKGKKTANTISESFESDLKLAEEVVKKYAEENEKLRNFTVSVEIVNAGLEPDEFKNIFPYWKT